LAGKKICFTTFLKENSMFWEFFRQIVYVFAPSPLKDFALPGKNSADAYVFKLTTAPLPKQTASKILHA
jgi:hypothetical protein